MRFGRLSSFWFLTAAGLALLGTTGASEESRSRRGRAIEFTPPRNDMVSSNVNELGAKKTTLKSLEQEIRKPFEWIGSGDDIVGPFGVAPRPRPIVPLAKASQIKELLEKRKEWIFIAPEDYGSLKLTGEEILNSPEFGLKGEEKKRTPIERYYERMEKARAEALSATNHSTAGDSLTKRQITAELEGLKELVLGLTENSSSPGKDETEQATEPLSPAGAAAFRVDITREVEGRSLGDIFGLGKSEASETATEKIRPMEARMNEFKQLLETRSLSPPNTAAGGFNSLIGSAGAAPPTMGMEGLRNGGLSGQGASPNTPAATFGSQSAAPGLGSASWQTTVSAPAPARLPLPAPTFNIPQRKF
jgi:hypothetical protein